MFVCFFLIHLWSLLLYLFMVDLLEHQRHTIISDEPDKQASLVSVLQLRLLCRQQQVRISGLLFLTLFVLKKKKPQIIRLAFCNNQLLEALIGFELIAIEHESFFTITYLFVSIIFIVTLFFHVFQSYHSQHSVMSNQNSAAGKYI